MNDWYEYYKNRVNKRYHNHIVSKYKPFTDMIMSTNRSLQALGKLHFNIELGCGIGSITKVLCELGALNHRLYDCNPYMLELAEKNLKKFIDQYHVVTEYRNITTNEAWSNFNAWERFILTKVKDNVGIKIVHSHGVLEHFDDDEIYSTLSYWQDDCIHYHYVPSHKYKEPSFGDERLLTADAWKQITGMNVIEFNNGYDYIITNNR